MLDQQGGALYYQEKGTQKLVRQEGFPDHVTQRNDVCFEEMDEVASCIQEGGRPETAGEEGLAAWAVMEAIIRSAKSGLPVEMKEVLKS
jgi:predicted dehydrogenase